jgi:hypothetical protein
METTAFFEKKISLSSKDLNKIAKYQIESIIEEKLKEKIEGKCSEHGYVIPGSIKLISRSIGSFEPGRFTGDVVYYTKSQGQVVYPADGIHLNIEVIRKNKLGIYGVSQSSSGNSSSNGAIHVIIPRDLHIGNIEYENVKIGNIIEVELKISKFQMDDPYITSSGIFIKNVSYPETMEDEMPPLIEDKQVVEEVSDNVNKVGDDGDDAEGDNTGEEIEIDVEDEDEGEDENEYGGDETN